MRVENEQKPSKRKAKLIARSFSIAGLGLTILLLVETNAKATLILGV